MGSCTQCSRRFRQNKQHHSCSYPTVHCQDCEEDFGSCAWWLFHQIQKQSDCSPCIPIWPNGCKSSLQARRIHGEINSAKLLGVGTTRPVGRHTGDRPSLLPHVRVRCSHSRPWGIKRIGQPGWQKNFAATADHNDNWWEVKKERMKPDVKLQPKWIWTGSGRGVFS